jgi:(2Fe-2S) ferredoxin
MRLSIHALSISHEQPPERRTDMAKPEIHILVCNSFRMSGEPQGVCNKKDAATLPQYIEDEVLDRGLDAMVSTTSCFKMCEKGPVLVVYPQGWWFSHVDEERVDESLDGIEDGQPAEGMMYA